jgi:hypothetical protein
MEARMAGHFTETAVPQGVSGAIPHIRVGSLLQFDPVRFEAWLKNH